jgi:hypothetical protein
MNICKRRNRQLQDELALRRKAREDAERQKKDEASNKVCVCVFANFYQTLSIDFKWFCLHLHVTFISVSYLSFILSLSLSFLSLYLLSILLFIYRTVDHRFFFISFFHQGLQGDPKHKLHAKLAGKSDEKDSLEQMKVRIRIIKRMDEEKKKSMITTESIFSVC